MAALSITTCTNNVDVRGVRRGACSLCTCSGFSSPNGVVLCGRCNHPPGRHENLMLSKAHTGRANPNTARDQQEAHRHLRSIHNTENPTLAKIGIITATNQETVIVKKDHTKIRNVCNDISSSKKQVTTAENKAVVHKWPVNTEDKQAVSKNEHVMRADNQTVPQGVQCSTLKASKSKKFGFLLVTFQPYEYKQKGWDIQI